MTDESGQGGLEGLVFGFALWVLGTLVIVNAWGAIDAKTATAGAAREATRAFVEAPVATPEAAMEEAVRAAEDTMAGAGRDPRRVVVVPEVAELRRCGRVTLRVEYPVPLLTIPVIGRYGRGFTASAAHSELVDPFRSGVAEQGSCPPELQP